MGILKDFADSALAVLKKKNEEVKKFIDMVDLSAPIDIMNDFELEFKHQLDKLKEQVKNLTDKFIVVVPFNKELETLNFNIVDNKITINVVSKDVENSCNTYATTTVTLIPDDVNTDSLIQRYDSKNHIMRLIFLKKINEVSTSNNHETPNKKIANKEKLVKRMIQMYENGMSYKKIAEKTGLSDKTVKRWIVAALQNK